jgi:hypothetical protein
VVQGQATERLPWIPAYAALTQNDEGDHFDASAGFGRGLSAATPGRNNSARNVPIGTSCGAQPYDVARPRRRPAA